MSQTSLSEQVNLDLTYLVKKHLLEYDCWSVSKFCSANHTFGYENTG